jgi:hypothetical protein
VVEQVLSVRQFGSKVQVLNHHLTANPFKKGKGGGRKGEEEGEGNLS